MPITSKVPHMLAGAGLRSRHYAYILENRPQVGWFEALSENYMDTDGRSLKTLQQIAEHYPIALHGVSLSIASVDSLSRDYLNYLTKLVKQVNPFQVSDHLCWTGVGGYNTHDLLPFPMNNESLNHVVGKIQQVQDYLGRALVLENISSYVTFKNSTYFEGDFIAEVLKRSGAALLLDVNNLFINAFNHNFKVEKYLEALTSTAVAQIHVAGHRPVNDYLFDTHEGPVSSDVWALYKQVVTRFGSVPTLVEWDTEIPEWPELQTEINKAQSILEGIN